MRLHRGSPLHLLERALKGHISLEFVVFTTIVLFWIVLALIAYMIVLRIYYAAKRRRMDLRRKIYEPAIALVLTEEPHDKVVEALRPHLPGDIDVVQEVILDAMLPLTGQPFHAFLDAATELGMIERNLEFMRTGDKYRKVNALEALGIMRARGAVPAITAELPGQTLDIKLVSLRALAVIGDPSCLPRFVETADGLPPAMLPRLASLMLEFGSPALPYIQQLIKSHHDYFPPRVMKVLLAEIAAAEELK